MNVDVVSADSVETPVTSFKYIINEDNTGTTEQRTPADGCSPDTIGYPASCHWTTAGIKSSAPIYTQGTQDDFPLLNLPDGRYLISVLADGYKLDGTHFTMPLQDNERVKVTVQAVDPTDPSALPDATIQAAIFEDISPTNSAPDLPAEHGLAGFKGEMKDYLGTLITDVYANPLCTIYDAAGGPIAASGGGCVSYCYVVDGGVDIGIVKPEGPDADNNIGPCPSDATVPGLKMWPLPVWVDPLHLDNRYAHPLPGDAYNVAVPTTAAIEGKLVIPHLGTNRYALSATAPNGTDWEQTTTLEGNHDWDAWVMEGATGLDTEFTVAGEPFPAIIFGYVSPKSTNGTTDMAASNANGVDGTSAGSITGVVDAVKVYVPAVGGLPNNAGQIWGGVTGSKIDKPIDQPWLSLSNLGNGDTSVWIGRGNANGQFTINHVPDGTYTLAWWDEPQDYIMDIQNITIVNGQQVDMGVLPLQNWWTQYEGYVFNDTNRNGVMDATGFDANGCATGGELGVPNYTLTMRKRENSLMDRGTTTVGTDACGKYYFESGYPMTQWLVMEAYNDLYYTTGVTYQADNQPAPTTVLGAGVDVSTLPIIGLSGRMDWGVHSYDATGATCTPVGSDSNCLDPRNGGIVGTVSYDTTRNELDARFAAVEDWQPGVSGLTVNLNAPVECPIDGSQPCDPSQRYQLNLDGSYSKGALLNTYVTETWSQPGADNNANGDADCTPRDVDGSILAYPTGQAITKPPYIDCLEAPLMGIQFQKGFSAVDGNYGFGDGCFGPGGYDPAHVNLDLTVGGCADGNDPTALAGATDYLVTVEVPDDAEGKPQYQFTKEEDINIANGDPWIPQLPPPPCAGPLHTVDVKDDVTGVDGWPATNYSVDPDTYELVVDPAGPISVPISTPVENATFVGIDGSPFEGQAKPSCDTKLVQVNNGKSIVPTFNVFTDVPLPARFWGLVVDDLNFSTNKQQINYGEKAGVPFVPVGIYDYTNRLVDTVESDYGGLFDVLEPSTNRISCPTPSGVCANLYRFVGNDPGVPGRLNPNYNPLYRTIAAEFEAIPGLIVPADLAPTQVGVNVQLPGGQSITPVTCPQDTATPQLFAVNRPFVGGPAADRNLTIQGLGFGASQGPNGQLLLGTTSIPVTSWTDTTITATVDANFVPGPYQLVIKSNNLRTTVSGLTFHVIKAPTPSIPTLAVLDSFNRGIANTLGASWTQLVISGNAALRVNANQALSNPNFFTGLVPNAYWTTAFGATQAAAFTMANTTMNGDSLILKANGTTVTPSNFIRVRYTTAGGGAVVVETTTNGGLGYTAQGPSLPGSFANGDTLTALANADGSVDVWKTTAANVTTHLGHSPAVAAFTGGGRIGMALPNGGRADNFAGGNATTAVAGPSYNPNVYEVGPGKPYAPVNSLPNVADHAIQRAITAAAASPGDDLVVVYPGLATPTNSRNNPRGAYYENLIINSPVKLQGVGPGGFQGTTAVPGTIIDGGAFGGDSAVATDWATLIGGLTWDGNLTINDGAIVSVYAHAGTFGSTFKAAIDGFDLRGGDQQGFPTNINAIGGGTTGLPGTIVTQGGAVFANAHADNLQITNNTVQNNGGGYGTIRIGTPDVGDNNNDNVKIANNRIIANGGTNLAGAIGLFVGSDNYEVAGNDLCGNFSAEYGAGISHFGRSDGGKIHDNKIWFNQSYDEGAGIMIAGELPRNPNANYGTSGGAQGSGPVDVYNNLLQANLSNDDGGGLRLLMVGNFPINVYNNTIVNNVSTHEGGGVALDDAPNVRFYNNTVMKNLTTATAITSSGQPAPAGLSTATNSAQLQATLPGGSPLFSNPLLFNNIFFDNRAGTRTPNSNIITGLATPVNNWDMGVTDGPGLLAPTNSVVQQNAGTHPYTTSPTNSSAAPLVVSSYDTVVAFDAWRTNVAFIGAILVSADMPPAALGDYRLTGAFATNLAIDRGAAFKAVPSYQQLPASLPAPAFDIENQARPAGGGFDIGSDELGAAVSLSLAPLTVADNFNTAGTTLGTAWTTTQGAVARNAGQAVSTGFSTSLTAATFNNRQLVGLTFANTPRAGTALLLEAGGGLTSLDKYIRVRFGGSSVVVATTANRGSSFSNRATYPATFVSGDKLLAMVIPTTAVLTSARTVSVYKISVATGLTTLLGSVVIPGSGAGSWTQATPFTPTTHIGMQLPNGARVDDFVGRNA